MARGLCGVQYSLIGATPVAKYGVRTEVSVYRNKSGELFEVYTWRLSDTMEKAFSRAPNTTWVPLTPEELANNAAGALDFELLDPSLEEPSEVM